MGAASMVIERVTPFIKDSADDGRFPVVMASFG